MFNFLNKQRVFKKDGREFIVRFERGKVYVGTVGLFSQIAAQLLTQDVMKPTGWRQQLCFADLFHNGEFAVGLCYEVPKHVNSRRAMSELFAG